MHVIWFWLLCMVAVFVKKCVGCIVVTHDNFCSWNSCQKMGKLHAEAVCHAQTDCGMLDHEAPFLTLPIFPAIAQDVWNNLADGNGFGICVKSVWMERQIGQLW